MDMHVYSICFKRQIEIIITSAAGSIHCDILQKSYATVHMPYEITHFCPVKELMVHL